MLRFDKVTYLSLLYQFISSKRLSDRYSVRSRYFAILRIHKYSIHSII